jgi:hypothetical protein
MATSPIQRPPAFPYGLVPFALYFAFIEAWAVYLLWRMGPAKTIPSFFESLFQGAGSAWLFFWPAFLELTLFAALAVGVLLVVVALLRKRMFSRVFVAWLQLNLLFFFQGVMGRGWDTVIAYGILLIIAIISFAGIAYAHRSKRMAAFFNR